MVDCATGDSKTVPACGRWRFRKSVQAGLGSAKAHWFGQDFGCLLSEQADCWGGGWWGLIVLHVLKQVFQVAQNGVPQAYIGIISIIQSRPKPAFPGFSATLHVTCSFNFSTGLGQTVFSNMSCWLAHAYAL